MSACYPVGCQCVWLNTKRVRICQNCPALVVIESPFAGNLEANMVYALECLLDSLRRGEAPFASHLLYTQVLNDRIPEERRRGIESGLAWGRCADFTVVYTDLGITPGMHLGISRAMAEGRPIVYRSIRPVAPHFSETDRD